MTHIAIAPPQARETAAAFIRSGSALETLQGQLRRQWAALDAQWQGSSKGRIEGEVYTALGQLTRLIENTRRLGLTLDVAAERFETADESTAFVVMPMAWSILPVVAQHSPADNEEAGG